MAANNILDNAVPVYHRFIDNQVLTDNQLNEVLDHLNYQDKLTRVSLIGTGIVCGLELTSTPSRITLSSGVAITTDGDILKHTSTTYKGFKEFKDENVRYAHFLDNDKTIQLYELEVDTTPTDVHELSQFQTKTGIAPDKMVAILYLENYLKEEEDCSPVDCNAQGREVANSIRVLLTSVAKAKKVAEKDSIFSQLLNTNEGDVINNVDKLLPKRIILNSGNTYNYEALKNAYVVNFHSLTNRIMKLGQLNLFTPLLKNLNLDIGQFLKFLVPNAGNFQYVYDFYKDLCNAFNDLLDALDEQYYICCPDPNAFPKHVLLGEVNHNPVYLRHSFYPSPIHDNAQSANQLRKLFGRIIQMIHHFLVTKKEQIRITPSKNDHFPLGERALPSYYNLEKSTSPNTILSKWNKGKTGILNYYRFGYPTPNFDPLDYSLDAHDFYRIEGHTGHNVFEALKSITGIRSAKGLAFDVLPVAVGANADEDAIDYDKYRIYFEDLQTILQAWNEEQKCLVKNSSKFLSGFSKDEKGKHIAWIEKAENITEVIEVQPTSIVPAVMMVAGTTEAKTEKRTGGKKKKKPRTNAVMENISKDDSAMGSIWGDKIDYSSGGSEIELQFKDSVKNVVKDWESEIVAAAVNIPAKVLGKLKETEDNKLMDIEDFKLENLKNYIQTLQAQCDAAKEAKKMLQKELDKPESKLNEQPWTEHYVYVINQLISSCCVIERIKVLYEQILDRKQELLGSMVLKEYIKKHPGAEHSGGVPKGGTFILLYMSTATKTKDNLKILDEIMTTGISTLKNKELTVKPGFKVENPDISELLSRGILSHIDLTRFPDLTESRFLLEKGLVQKEHVGHGVVLGDLCLPYICCSDTPSTTFVFPDQEVNLFINKPFICKPMNGEVEPILLEVTPTDGKIVALAEGNEINDVIISNGDKFFFDGTKLPNELLGKTINFTVNGQNVEATIKVYQQPVPSFKPGANAEFTNENTIAKIVIENTSTPIQDQVFSWDFGLGGSETQNALKFEQFYKVKPGQTFEFNIILTASNGPCSSTADQLVTIVVPAIDGEDKCIDVTKEILSKGKNDIELDLQRNRRILAEQVEFYKEIFLQLYNLIFDNLEEVLEGGHDGEIFEIVNFIQKQITERLHPNLNGKEQEFLLRLYYENLLIYFYVQACRDERINARSPITGSWHEFTNNATDTFIEPFKSLLKTDSVHIHLGRIRKKEDARLSGPLKELLNELIKLIKSIV